jgi:hypothetical protein
MTTKPKTRKAPAPKVSMVRSNDFTTDDKRSVNAVVELASAVADHASAAEFIFNTSE